MAVKAVFLLYICAVWFGGLHCVQGLTATAVEGQNVTFPCQSSDSITWYTGNVLVAQHSFSFQVPRYNAAYESGRVKLHTSNGSLTIFNVSLADQGDYACHTSDDIVSHTMDVSVSAGQCQAGCTCVGRVVNCTGRGIPDVLENIPADIQNLDLSNNAIVQLPARVFSGLRQLQYLDLSNNAIVQLPARVFSGLRQLQYLYLGNNSIDDISPDAFYGLDALMYLQLQANNIQYLANGTFTPLQNIRGIDLSNNPWLCDCNLEWLTGFLQLPNVGHSGAQCRGPQPLWDRMIDQLNPSNFTCQVCETSGGCVSVKPGEVAATFPGLVYTEDQLYSMLRSLYGSHGNISEPTHRVYPHHRDTRQSEHTCHAHAEFAIHSSCCTTCVKLGSIQPFANPITKVKYYMVETGSWRQFVPVARCSGVNPCTNCRMVPALFAFLVTTVPTSQQEQSSELNTRFVMRPHELFCQCRETMLTQTTCSAQCG